MPSEASDIKNHCHPIKAETIIIIAMIDICILLLASALIHFLVRKRLLWITRQMLPGLWTKEQKGIFMETLGHVV
jgi:hypothetical protein